MKILSSFTHPQVVANLFEFLLSAEHKGRYFEERLASLTSHGIYFSTMDVNVAKQLFGANRSSKYLPLCSIEERNWFATTLG